MDIPSFKKLKPVVKLLSWSKMATLPGFGGLPLYEVARFFYHGMRKDAMTEKAASISFNFLLAIFPGIIFLFTLISYIPIENFHGVLLTMLKGVIPELAYDVSVNTIEDIIDRQRGGFLSFGFVFALLFSTQGIIAMIQAFNNTIYATESRNWFAQQCIAIGLVFIMTVLLVFAVGLIIVADVGLDFLVRKGIIKSGFVFYLLAIGDWLTIWALYYFGISFIYYFGPTKKPGFRFLSPGSIVATILTVLSSYGFNFYIENFNKYNILYGSIGILMLIMLWLYLNSLVLLIGFELNASIYTARDQR
jgi:membrane protein